MDKGACAPQGEEVIADTSPGEDGGDAGNDFRDDEVVQGFGYPMGTCRPGGPAARADRFLWSVTFRLMGDLTDSHISKSRCGAPVVAL